MDGFADFGMTFGNPDFALYAQAYGAHGRHVSDIGELAPALEAAFRAGGVHLLAVPVDYSENTRVLELETKHPQTGLPIRLFDTRNVDRVRQRQTSLIEIEMLNDAGHVTRTHTSRTTTRWIYQFEMELLLRLAGFERFKISGAFDGRPLLHDTDGMVVQAWKEE